MNSIDYIVVGLGNPDKKYESTRHNTGFMVVDYIAKKLNAKMATDKFSGLCSSVIWNGKKILLLKPQTYMNLSGKSVLSAMSFYKVKPDNIILIFDDISLPVGKMRIRKKGSHGGQNGVKNIIALCGSDKFPRIKIGIGSKPNENWDLADWVLSKFSKTEMDSINEMSECAYEALEMIISDKIDEAMNKFN